MSGQDDREWVVVEWNQASGVPDVLGGLLTREDAEIARTEEVDAATRAGRRDRYTLARVVIEEVPA